MDSNYNYLNSFVNLNKDIFVQLQKIAVKKTIEPHTYLEKKGVKPNKIYLLADGIVRVFLLLDNGKEINKNLFFPISFVASLTALIKEEASTLNYQTLTTCTVYELDFNTVKEFMKTHESVKDLYLKILENVYVNYEARQLELASLDATERYLKLRKQYPNIDNLIPQFQIASYLNITPVQLSRIRKTLSRGTN
jgi:CRP-like cAMP-binding protein